MYQISSCHTKSRGPNIVLMDPKLFGNACCQDSTVGRLNLTSSDLLWLRSMQQSFKVVLLLQYGNKLFQSDFIGIIQPGTSLIGLLQFNLLNSSVALVGYYAAAFTIDKTWMGRRRMQVSLLKTMLAMIPA